VGYILLVDFVFCGYSWEPVACLYLLTFYSGADNTRRGHILGAAQVRNPAPERQMTAASTSVVRLLLHMSMYLGATESPQVFLSF